MKLPPLLRSLAHRNFRLYFLGQAISLIGTWMQQVALSWLVYGLSERSAWWLGVVGFATQAPSFFVGPLAGVLIDRYPRHRILLGTQALFMVKAFVLASLALSGTVQIWHVLVLGVLLGLVNAVDMPARQAFLTELVSNREDLSNAIALNSSVFNGARLIGPALAGLVLAGTNAGVCFAINGLSYLAVLAALLAMTVPLRPPPTREPFGQRLREGVAYAFGFSPIRDLIVLLAVVSLVGMPFTVLLPVFATEVLHGEVVVLGFLSAAAGVGALAGAILLASRRSVLGLGRWVAAGPGCFGLTLIAFAFSRSLGLSLLLMLLAGFALMMYMASSNTILQTIVEEDKARAGDEFVYGGVHGHDAAGKPAGGRRCGRGRRSDGGGSGRRLLRGGVGVVCPATAALAREGAANLRQHGHPAGGGDRTPGRHGADDAAGAELMLTEPHPPTPSPKPTHRWAGGSKAEPHPPTPSPKPTHRWAGGSRGRTPPPNPLPEAHASMGGGESRQNPTPQPPPRSGEGEQERSCSPSPFRGGGWGVGFRERHGSHDALHQGLELAMGVASPLAELHRLAQRQTRVRTRHLVYRHLLFPLQKILVVVQFHQDADIAQQLEVAVEAAHVQPQPSQQGRPCLAVRPQQAQQTAQAFGAVGGDGVQRGG